MVYRLLLLTGLAIGCAATLLPTDALAWGAPLEHPSLAMPEGLDAGRLMETLSRPDFTFVTGWFINAHTVMFYTGDADQLSAFLEAVTQHSRLAVHLRFSAEVGEASSRFPLGERGVVTAPCQWSVDHQGWGTGDAITVTVFLGDGTIRPEQVVFPAWSAAVRDRRAPVQAPKP